MNDEKAEMGHVEQTMSNSTVDPKSEAYNNGRSWGDAAQAILGANAHAPVIVSPEDNARILRKTDIWLLPVMLGYADPVQPYDSKLISGGLEFTFCSSSTRARYPTRRCSILPRTPVWLDISTARLEVLSTRVCFYVFDSPTKLKTFRSAIDMAARLVVHARPPSRRPLARVQHSGLGTIASCIISTCPLNNFAYRA
jgi:hypothetical protein